MIFLFTLILCSVSGFSMYLYLFEHVQNPLVFVLLGWGTVVFAHYFSYFFDRLKLNILNRHFQAFVVNADGLFWNGVEFTDDDSDTIPELFFNSVQALDTVEEIIQKTGNKDLYIRIMSQNEE